MYLDKNTSYKIKDIKINTIVPFYFEIIRIIIITIIIFMFYIFRPKSQIYNINFLEYKNKIIPITLLILGQIVLSTFIFYTNVDYRFDKYQHHHQYHYLAESLSKGKVSLDLPVSEKLKKLSNPYDYNLRKANNVKKDKDFYWDHAYYKGKYYVYFGVLPVLTAHLPYYLITGEELLNHRVFYVVGILTIIS